MARRSLVRAVIDTNALLATERDELVLLAANGRYQIIWSQFIVDELRRKMIDLGWNPHKAQALLSLVAEIAELVDDREITGGNYDRWLFDVDDFPIMATALAGGAEYIVTWNTRDFPPKRRFAGVTILTPDAFIRLLTHPAHF